MIDIHAEDYLPHRGRMKLIDTIVHVNTDKAVTESVVNAQWPLLTDDHVSSIILIELAAQTSGIYIAWNREKEKQRTGNERGWVVGIKSASFYTPHIKVGTRISTHATSGISVDTYMKLNSKVYILDELVGEVGLQLFWIESDEPLNNSKQ